MGKNNLLLGYQQGSIGDVTFSRQNGVLTTRARNRQPRNPRSVPQMTQRVSFSPVAAFYSRATANLFKFAFERKGKGQSDYLRFVQINSRSAEKTWYSQQHVQDVTFPLINQWQMSEGSLPSMLPGLMDSETEGEIVVFSSFGPSSSAKPTNWDIFLRNNTSLRRGDIVTVCVVSSLVKWDSNRDVWTTDLDVPSYTIRQFRVGGGANPSQTLEQYLQSCGFSLDSGTALQPEFEGELTGWFAAPDVARPDGITVYWNSAVLSIGYCVLVSRKMPSGWKVSTSRMYLNENAKASLQRLQSDEEYQIAIESYGDTQEAVLDGQFLPD